MLGYTGPVLREVESQELKEMGQEIASWVPLVPFPGGGAQRWKCVCKGEGQSPLQDCLTPACCSPSSMPLLLRVWSSDQQAWYHLELVPLEHTCPTPGLLEQNLYCIGRQGADGDVLVFITYSQSRRHMGVSRRRA